MIPTGRLDGDDLVLTRTLASPVDDVWAGLTEPERLARWFGTWTGDPAQGWVMVTMNAEGEPQAPARYDIVACEPPRRLEVRVVDDAGAWHLSAELSTVGPGTRLVLRQHDVDAAGLGDTGPGWEWYLDRLAAALGGTAAPSLADFEADYLTMAAAYEAMRR